MNNICIIGRTVREPELKTLQSGKTVARMTLAVDKGLSKEMKADFESKGKPTADFINVVLWGKMGETAAKYVGKGKLVGISGRLEINMYEKDGQKRSYAQVNAYNLDILEWSNNSSSGANDELNEDDFDDIDDVFEPTSDSEFPF